MIDALLRTFVRFALWLRYRTRVSGIEAVAQRGTRGILFLPNHPAIIDPPIVIAHLHKQFRPRPLADRDQTNRPGVRWFVRRVGVRPVPDLARHGAAAREQVGAVVTECIAGLRSGENILLYPSGHLYRSRHENLRGNSAVEMILQGLADVRIVLIRTRGLWGSSFSFARGEYPNLARGILRKLPVLLKNLILFAPRRRVSIELFEPDDLPRAADRNTLNAYIEAFYNEDAPPNVYVPYTHWESGGVRKLPDPHLESSGHTSAVVPEATRAIVLARLTELTDVSEIPDDARLAPDLGLDSLARADLVVWLGREFGHHAADAASLRTVADVLLAACGESAVTRPVELKPVPRRWRPPSRRIAVTIPEGETIQEVFLTQARRRARQVVFADQISGVRTYRDVLTAILALKPVLEKLPGERIGIMLPASVAAALTYLAALFSGKTPVMVNWTTGARNTAHALDLCGVSHVLTAGPLVSRIESQGADLSSVQDRFLYIERIGKQITRGAKLRAAIRARLSWAALRDAPAPQTAVILLTSGSETLPKAVPLSHTNLLTNVRDILRTVTLYESDNLLGFLPPFHSFGLTVTTLLPALAGLRAVYHANPTESWALAQLVEAYRTTALVGTPTFLGSIARAARPGQLDTLRIAVTGAESCPERTYAALARACPNAVILEGYGVTECSPIVAANRERDAQPHRIGRIVPSVEHAIVDVQGCRRVGTHQTGMLLVRGPSVFGGYLGDDVASPFVEFERKQWYRTGDLVSEDQQGVLTFRGRLKRFIKLGGEMISLPAIEDVLLEHFRSDDDQGPLIAVEATATDDHPEIVLFSTRDVDRPTVNQYIRAAHLSPLHNVNRIIRVQEIPLLGTGKTDYRKLRESLGPTSHGPTSHGPTSHGPTSRG